MSVPSWVKDAVFYQIFPDRFSNGSKENDPVNVQSWGSVPTRWGFQGGDLRGITQRMDYLVDLGVNALYLNPIFLSPSNHRYDTIDYFRIDPKLGDMDDFRELINSAHRNGLRVILDGVFNHCSRGFFAFIDLLENEEESPYRDWFHVRKFPLRAYDKGSARNYAAWWGIKSLPKFNTSNPDVRRYLLHAARYWIEEGADGWRLDVPNEINDDSFWAEFREVVASANPEAYTLGEIWDGDPRWVGSTHFDGLMHYPFGDAVEDLVNGKMTGAAFGGVIEALLRRYPAENAHAMYLLLDSHDTERALTAFGEDAAKFQLALQIVFAYPGCPAIYYGDEIGLAGGKDPDCRGAFPWNSQDWNQPLRDWVKLLINIRKEYPAMRGGSFQLLSTGENTACCAFARTLEGAPGKNFIIAAVNPTESTQNLVIEASSLGAADGRLRDLTGEADSSIQSGRIELKLAPYCGAYLTR